MANIVNVVEHLQFETCLTAHLADEFVRPGASWSAHETYHTETVLRGWSASIVDGAVGDRITAPQDQIFALASHMLVTLTDEGADRDLYRTHLDQLLSSPLEERVDRLEKALDALLNEKGREAAKRLGADLSEPLSTLDSKRFVAPFLLQHGSRVRVRLDIQPGAPRLTQPAIIRINLFGLKKRMVL